MAQSPRAICGPAYDLVQRVSPLVRELDFGLDWMELEAGRALYRCVSCCCKYPYHVACSLSWVVKFIEAHCVLNIKS